MLHKERVKDIRPNPFQPRKAHDAEAIQSLSEEIAKVGLWPGALRGREKNGHVELCFGHRRLEAVKLLDWEEVDIDVVELSDEDMALQALIENLQREGLNDADKADGIAAYIKLKTGIEDLSAVSGSGGKNKDESKEVRTFLLSAKEEIGRLLGLHVTRVNELLRIAGWDESMKQPIREQKISGQSAVRAERIAGAEGVKVAAEKGLSVHTAIAITEELGKIEDEEVKEKVRESFARGKISSADDVVKTARQAKGQAVRRAQNIPPDLLDIMRSWTERAHRWAGELEQVAPYMRYIDGEPKVAERWRAAVGKLIEKLEKFV